MKQPTLSLRLATNKDAYFVVAMSKKLFEESAYKNVSVFDSEVLYTNYYNSCRLPLNEYCTILLFTETEEQPIGFISCGQSKNQFSNDKYACELGFYILPEFKTLAGMKKLLEAYYYWAKETGCVAALMGKLQPGKIESYRMKVLR